MRRGRGRGRQAGARNLGRGDGTSRQEDAAEWFLAAADIEGSAGVSDMHVSSVDRPNLAAEYAREVESRRSLRLLSDEDIRQVLQQFLVDHASVGEAVRVVASDTSRVRNALLSDARLREVMQHSPGGSLRGDPGQDFWDQMVRTFLGHLHLVHRPPRRLGD